MSNDVIQRASEVAAMGPATTKMSPNVDRDAADAMLVRGHNALRAGFLAAMEAYQSLDARYAIMLGEHKDMAEQLRRAQLLTPDAVKAVCEREGFEMFTDGYASSRTESIDLALAEDEREWIVTRRGPMGIESEAYCLTIGQLEDAIKQAKVASNA